MEAIFYQLWLFMELFCSIIFFLGEWEAGTGCLTDFVRNQRDLSCLGIYRDFFRDGSMFLSYANACFMFLFLKSYLSILSAFSSALGDRSLCEYV